MTGTTSPKREAWAASRTWDHETHFLWDTRAAPTLHCRSWTLKSSGKFMCYGWTLKSLGKFTKSLSV